MRITKPEAALICFLKRHLLLFGVLGAVVVSFIVRVYVFGAAAMDGEDSLLPLFQALRQGGLERARALPAYNTAYSLLLLPATLLPFADMVCIKLVSTLFDYATALAMVWAVLHLVPQEAGNRKLLAVGTFVVSLFLPIPLMNSAMWGQNDSVYTFFLLLCFVLLLKRKYTVAFTMYSMSFLLNGQAVFFLPAVLMLYSVQRRFSILQFLQIPFFVFLMGLWGRKPGDSLFWGFAVYGKQLQANQSLYRGYPNIFSTFGEGDFASFAPPAVLFAAIVFFCMWVYILAKGWKIEGDALLLLGVWCIFTCTIFLPAMGKRGGFAAELLVWLFFMARPNLRRFSLALVLNFIPLLVYINIFYIWLYLLPMTMSLINVLAYIFVSVATVLYLKKTNDALPVQTESPPTMLEQKG